MGLRCYDDAVDRTCGSYLARDGVFTAPHGEPEFADIAAQSACIGIPISAMHHLRKGQRSLWLTIWLIFICLFLAGSIFQHYAEGMWLLASSLLTRDVCILHIIRKREAESHNADAAAIKKQR